MQERPLPSVEYLRECFDYRPETGEFYWKHRPLEHFISSQKQKMNNTKFAGKKIAVKQYKNQYRTVNLFGQRFYLHRIAWALSYGEIDGMIDHINGDTLDNRLANLRLATRAQNSRNSKKPRTNTSGYKGVSYHKRYNVYQAQITVNNKLLYLGSYPSPQLAYQAYCAASAQYHGEYGRLE